MMRRQSKSVLEPDRGVVVALARSADIARCVERKHFGRLAEPMIESYRKQRLEQVAERIGLGVDPPDVRRLRIPAPALRSIRHLFIGALQY
jgi:hypothetical protein